MVPVDCQQTFARTACNCTSSAQTLYPVVTVSASGGGAPCANVSNSTAVCSIDDFNRDCPFVGVIGMGLYELRVVNMDTGNLAVSGDNPLAGYQVNVVFVNTGSSAVSQLQLVTYGDSHEVVVRSNWTIASTPGTRTAEQFNIAQSQIGSVFQFLAVATQPGADPLEFVFDWPGPGVVNMNDTVQVVVAFNTTTGSDLVSVSYQLCLEIRSLLGSADAPCLVTEVAASTAKVALQLTSALLLQQYTNDPTLLDPNTYPIFSTSTQLVLLYPTGSIDPSLPAASAQYDMNCTFSACASTDVCTQGVCTCRADANGFCLDDSTCASGAPSHFADVCEDPSSTPDHLLYRGQCADHEAGSVNLFPRRRFCQRLDRPIGTAKLMLNGMLGRVGVAEPVLFFTIQSPYTLSELLTDKRNATTGIVSFDAYVSNLYDGAAPRSSKAWAHIEFGSFYANSTVQLTKLRFLDAIEGAASYYFQDTHWHAVDSADLPSMSYEYLADNAVPAWDCQAYRVYNPVTNACEPGCNNTFAGSNCTTVMDPTTCMEFNATTTLYVSYGCDQVVCLPGFVPGFDGCVVESSSSTASHLFIPDSTGVAAVAPSNLTAFGQSMAIIVSVGVILVVVTGAITAAVVTATAGAGASVAPTVAAAVTRGRNRTRPGRSVSRSNSQSQSRSLNAIAVVSPSSRAPSRSSSEARLVAAAVPPSPSTGKKRPLAGGVSSRRR